VDSVQSRAGQRISPIFLAIVAVTAISGLITWRYGQVTINVQGGLAVEQPARLALFFFVVGGWIISLCLHEFGHAFLAHRFGDHSIASRGYLTLDPRKYADLTLSILIPVFFLLLGGIGLPGGAVWIDRGAIQGKIRHSLVSAAGPLVNLAFAIALGVAVSNVSPGTHSIFWAGVSFLAFLQVTAAVLNLLPIPGLDGFGIIEPYLPHRFVAKVAPIGGFIFLGLILLLWLPPINDAFFDIIYDVTDLFGISEIYSQVGGAMFRFWNQ
jgi:Zn-dependent protease